MNHRVLVSLGALAAAMSGGMAPVRVAGQAPAGVAAPQAAGERWAAPRTPDGQPDLQGIWSNSSYTPLERPAQFANKDYFTEEEAEAFYSSAASIEFGRDPEVHYSRTEYGLDKWQNGVKANLRTSLIVDPPDGRLPPLTPEARKRLAAQPGRSADIRTRTSYERCETGYWGTALMLKGGGGGSGADVDLGTGADAEHQILQIPGYVVILAQSNNDVRIIPLDGRPHLSSKVTRWFGDSRGRWEGKTLVVETTNFNDVIRFKGHSVKALRLVERFSRLEEDQLLYEFTIDDPTTWTKPWTAQVAWARVNGPIFEFTCHETNYGLLNVIKGELAASAAAK